MVALLLRGVPWHCPLSATVPSQVSWRNLSLGIWKTFSATVYFPRAHDRWHHKVSVLYSRSSSDSPVLFKVISLRIDSVKPVWNPPVGHPVAAQSGLYISRYLLFRIRLQLIFPISQLSLHVAETSARLTSHRRVRQEKFCEQHVIGWQVVDCAFADVARRTRAKTMVVLMSMDASTRMSKRYSILRLDAEMASSWLKRMIKLFNFGLNRHEPQASGQMQRSKRSIDFVNYGSSFEVRLVTHPLRDDIWGYVNFPFRCLEGSSRRSVPWSLYREYFVVVSHITRRLLVVVDAAKVPCTNGCNYPCWSSCPPYLRYLKWENLARPCAARVVRDFQGWNRRFPQCVKSEYVFEVFIWTNAQNTVATWNLIGKALKSNWFGDLGFRRLSVGIPSMWAFVASNMNFFGMIVLICLKHHTRGNRFALILWSRASQNCVQNACPQCATRVSSVQYAAGEYLVCWLLSYPYPKANLTQEKV